MFVLEEWGRKLGGGKEEEDCEGGGDAAEKAGAGSPGRSADRRLKITGAARVCRRLCGEGYRVSIHGGEMDTSDFFVCFFRSAYFGLLGDQSQIITHPRGRTHLFLSFFVD